jgi:hypothetical protein
MRETRSRTSSGPKRFIGRAAISAKRFAIWFIVNSFLERMLSAAVYADIAPIGRLEIHGSSKEFAPHSQQNARA